MKKTNFVVIRIPELHFKIKAMNTIPRFYCEKNIVCIFLTWTGDVFYHFIFYVSCLISGLDCEIDILAVCKQVRHQRPGMIQTQSQYNFVYSAIKQHVLVTKAKLEKVNSHLSKYENRANTRRCPNVVPMLGQHRRRWGITVTLGRRLVSTVPIH